MQEAHGWYHHTIGYWETIGTPPDELTSAYPEGTVAFPLRPDANHQLIDGRWVYVEPEAVKVELKPVTRRQLRLTLVREGISLATVEALINAMPEGLEKEEAQIEWADATEFERSHPTLLLIAHALELTTEKVDEMWLKAMAA